MAKSDVMVFRHAYSDPCRDSDLVCADPSLAQQQFRDEVDINVLLERFKVTGQMPGSFRAPSYGDFSGVSDFRSAMEVTRAASGEFMRLPAEIRARFGNDPQRLLEFVSDPANQEEGVRLGLFTAKPDVLGDPAKPGEGAVPPAKPAT